VILIIDMSSNPLSRWEFVEPIRKIVKDAGFDCRIEHYTKINATSIVKYDRIILCGTAIADNEFLRHDFSWLRATKKPVFGVCAGMEVIAKTFGGSIVDTDEIGMIEIDTDDKLLGKGKVSAYGLHGKGVSLPEGFTETASNGSGVQGMKKDNIYAIQFHPEVRNEKILEKWLKN